MKIRWWAFLAVLALSACAEEDDAEADTPEPVAPVAVAVDDDEAEDEPDVAALQARVAELESQLAQEEQGEDVEPTTPESAELPQGVDAPAQAATADAEDDDDEGDAEGAEESEGSSSRRRRRRDRDDERVIINPLDVLLGE